MARAAACASIFSAVGRQIDYDTADYYQIRRRHLIATNAQGHWDRRADRRPHVRGDPHWSGFVFGVSRSDGTVTNNSGFSLRGLLLPLDAERRGPTGSTPAPKVAMEADQVTRPATPSRAERRPPQRPDGQPGPRMAYTANAAIMPRNKFTPDIAQADGGSGQRLNRFVSSGEIRTPAPPSW